ncbi:claudin-8 [Brachyhypopomus gauderio]|uniref:claudin-8 n=1 Tax=Brachyhypopomus gauderio TaxID=698409 RepID=UPI0040419884
MAAQGLEIAAMCLTLVGLMGAAASTGMPMWRVTAFIQENIIVMETRWEGLWMNCFRQANIRMQCKVYDSLLYLPPELQASRGLMCCSVALSFIGLVIAIAGMKCTVCIQGDDGTKHKVLVAAGCLILLACIACLIPVSWTAHVIIQDFYNPLLLDAQRRELGEALYVGWVAGALLFVGGCIFTCCSAPEDEGVKQSHVAYTHNVPYVAYQPHPMVFQPRSAAAYSYSSREPSFIQPSREHSFIQPSREHSFIQTARQPSLVQPARHQSIRSAVAYL